ncbi:serine/threonine-protein kinase [Actinomycetospora lemnae]|uniref:non-specific serine/threonine protein kinase n=1 Tax=Actinomycetospora lemnae TaxID=3019891 RepID=A0ABT5T3P3_9PSEU|nr:serine/threonine-protein kinase [Actinomycetospora sp. DW7H6]MDD7969320.1 protein kinase [Actinomycetospora sp. DW7H6]
MSTEAPGHTPPSDPSGGPAEMFGPYRLEERIGRGGMGEVFRAYDTSRQRTVALKRLHGGLADDGEYQERFRRESRTAARLSSPHVIPIHDFGTIDGHLFIDMRLVSGVDLAEEIERHGRLEPARAVEIVHQVAEALDAAHDDGLVHRDVKPSNVLITQHRGRDFVYLVDFGIVRAVGAGAQSLTGTGTAIGTLAYMAPELFLNRDLDRRVDVYALGCLLFEAIAGRPPFVSEGPALMYDHLNETPPRLSEVAPGSPPALDAVLATAMAKDPARRYATAGDLAVDAAAALRGERVGGEQPTTTSPAPGPAPRASGPQGATPTVVPGPRPASGPEPWRPSQGPAPYRTAGTGMPMGGPGPFPPPPPAPGTVRYTEPGGRSPEQGGRDNGRTAAIVAGVVVVLLLVVVGAVALLVQRNAGTTTTAAPPSASTPSAPAGPSSPSAPSAPSSGTAQLSVTEVFPDAAGADCRPSGPQDRLTTSTGVDPAEAVICRYPGVAPDARVIFARWPDTAGAQAFYRDTETLGPRVDQYQTWSLPGGASQGPLYTAERDGTIYSTGLYDGLPYSWEIRTATMDQSWAVWNQLHFRPRAEIGG